MRGIHERYNEKEKDCARTISWEEHFFFFFENEKKKAYRFEMKIWTFSTS